MSFPSNKLKVGETVSLRIEEISSKAQGVATLGNQAILIKESLPGDQVQVRLTRVRSTHAEAKLIRVEVGSPDRVTPRCLHFGPCGGCDLQHLQYPLQVEWKKKSLQRILIQEGGLQALPPIETTAMEDPWDYRSKMEFTFGQEGPRVTLGFHERASFQRIVDIGHCHIAPPAVSDLLKEIKEVAQRFPLKSYNPKIHQGFWRYAVVRSSFHTGEMMLLIITNEGPQEPIDALAAHLGAHVPALKSFYWGVSAKVSDVASPERMMLISGSEVLEDQVGEIRFQIRPTNFVQPNLYLASQVYGAIAQAAKLTSKEVVCDLYCGIGLIALSLAKGAQAVYGVESESENVVFAERNAALNNITNTLFIHGKVEDLLRGRALFKAGPRPDVVILDPPRAGLHKEVYAPLLTASVPRLLYLSCNPTSLARDLKIFLERDGRLQVETIQMFDFFPHTAHMEVLVALHRR